MTEINYQELNEKLSSFTLVDLRTLEEIKTNGKLSNAFYLPVQELEEALNLNRTKFKSKYGFCLPPPEGAKASNDSEGVKEEDVVFYCRSGRRVGVANEMLLKKGYKKHRLYYGSFLDWQEKGGAITKLE